MCRMRSRWQSTRRTRHGRRARAAVQAGGGRFAWSARVSGFVIDSNPKPEPPRRKPFPLIPDQRSVNRFNPTASRIVRLHRRQRHRQTRLHCIFPSITMATLMPKTRRRHPYIQKRCWATPLHKPEILHSDLHPQVAFQIHELDHPADHDREEPDPDGLESHRRRTATRRVKSKAPTRRAIRAFKLFLAASSCSSPVGTGS